MTKRTRFQRQAVKMNFLCRVSWLSLRKGDELHHSGELRVKLLLLDNERSKLRQFGHMMRMPPGLLPLDVFWAYPTGKRQIQNILEGLCIVSGLGMSQSPPEGVVKEGL